MIVNDFQNKAKSGYNLEDMSEEVYERKDTSVTIRDRKWFKMRQ
jgi:hypothetical protein